MIEIKPEWLAEMRAALRVHGYPIAAARALAAEGMGPEELAHRIRSTTPGGTGSLEFTHGITRRAAGHARRCEERAK